MVSGPIPPGTGVIWCVSIKSCVAISHLRLPSGSRMIPTSMSIVFSDTFFFVTMFVLPVALIIMSLFCRCSLRFFVLE